MVLYMEKQVDKKSYVGLDDLTILSHKCQPHIDCDFDNGRICSYSPFKDQTTNNNFNFGILTGKLVFVI